MRSIPALAILLALAASACGGSSKAPTPTATQTSRSGAPGSSTSPAAGLASATAPALTPSPATRAPAGAILEVTGIVGRVVLNTRVIGIKQLAGAQVTEIDVDPAASIRRAGGDSIRLADIRPSNRIIARGKLNDRRDALVATEVTVQDVISGAPGG